MPLAHGPRRRLALAQGPALPGLSQTPRSLQHTSHIKRKQVTQMRQMVLVCDDSCNSFSSSPPPLFFPLGFPLVSLLFLALKRPRCATRAERARGSGSWASRRGHVEAPCCRKGPSVNCDSSLRQCPSYAVLSVQVSIRGMKIVRAINLEVHSLTHSVTSVL